MFLTVIFFLVFLCGFFEVFICINRIAHAYTKIFFNKQVFFIFFLNYFMLYFVSLKGNKKLP